MVRDVDVEGTGHNITSIGICRLGDSDEAILGGVGHSEGVALGVAG